MVSWVKKYKKVFKNINFLRGNYQVDSPET